LACGDNGGKGATSLPLILFASPLPAAGGFAPLSRTPSPGWPPRPLNPWVWEKPFALRFPIRALEQPGSPAKSVAKPAKNRWGRPTESRGAWENPWTIPDRWDALARRLGPPRNGGRDFGSAAALCVRAVPSDGPCWKQPRPFPPRPSVNPAPPATRPGWAWIQPPAPPPLGLKAGEWAGWRPLGRPACARSGFFQGPHPRSQGRSLPARG